MEHSPLGLTRRKKYQELMSGTGNFRKKFHNYLIILSYSLYRSEKILAGPDRGVSIRLAESGSPWAEAVLRDRAVIYRWTPSLSEIRELGYEKSAN